MIKTSVTYIYSQDCETANYLQYLIDQVRNIDGINFEAICFEEQDISKKNLNKLKSEIDTLVKEERFALAADKRTQLGRLNMTKKYSTILPVIRVKINSEHEIVTTGSKKSLAAILDYVNRISDVGSFLGSIDFSAFDTVLRKVVDLSQEKVADRGLETIEGDT